MNMNMVVDPRPLLPPPPWGMSRIFQNAHNLYLPVGGEVGGNVAGGAGDGLWIWFENRGAREKPTGYVLSTTEAGQNFTIAVISSSAISNK